MVTTRRGTNTRGRSTNPGRIKRAYKPNDPCHRHRKKDNSAKSVSVTTYKRRKPIK